MRRAPPPWRTALDGAILNLLDRAALVALVAAEIAREKVRRAKVALRARRRP